MVILHPFTRKIKMKLISLFSGIGGFELAGEWMGWTPVLSCEINPFGRKVLQHYWPDAYHHDDIHTLNIEKINEELSERYGENWADEDLILTGGFPCQPYSTAGKRLGKADERHLFPEMLRVIRELRPRYVVGENVRGLVSWSGGLVFEQVCADLEAEGYEVQPFILPACAVNAPHRRERVWFIAHSNLGNDGRTSRQDASAKGKKRIQERDEVRQSEDSVNIRPEMERPTPNANERTEKPPRTSREVESNWGENDDEPSSGGEQAEQHTGWGNVLRAIANTNSGGLEGTKEVGRNSINVERQGEFGIATDANSGRQPRKEHGKEEPGWAAKESISNYWENFPTQSPICGGDDGLPSELVGITFPKWRNESIKAYGNAIVPQVAYEIFKAIEALR